MSAQVITFPRVPKGPAKDGLVTAYQRQVEHLNAHIVEAERLLSNGNFAGALIMLRGALGKL